MTDVLALDIATTCGGMGPSERAAWSDGYHTRAREESALREAAQRVVDAADSTGSTAKQRRESIIALRQVLGTLSKGIVP